MHPFLSTPQHIFVKNIYTKTSFSPFPPMNFFLQHVICFFTSRTEEHREVTEEWLNKNGFKYHDIIFGKPRGGNYHWIDNHIVRATRYTGKFTNLVEKTSNIQVFDE